MYNATFLPEPVALVSTRRTDQPSQKNPLDSLDFSGSAEDFMVDKAYSVIAKDSSAYDVKVRAMSDKDYSMFNDRVDHVNYDSKIQAIKDQDYSILSTDLDRDMQSEVEQAISELRPELRIESFDYYKSNQLAHDESDLKLLNSSAHGLIGSNTSGVSHISYSYWQQHSLSLIVILISYHIIAF